MKIAETVSSSLLSASKLPASDYVANPYTGCTHSCLYCYASFMKRFTGHSEDWGDFLDVKQCAVKKLPKALKGKTVLLSSVTDPYNPYELRYRKSRELLELLKESEADVEILTKSDLVTRDLDLLKKMPRLSVGISLSTLDDNFRRDTEPCAPSVERRLSALETLHSEGIRTYLFISPIFPALTDINTLVQRAAPYTDKICFENLNLYGAARAKILSYISEKYPQHYPLYENIYQKGNNAYWEELKKEIENISKGYDIPFVDYFYHKKIKKGGKNNAKVHKTNI